MTRGRVCRYTARMGAAVEALPSKHLVRHGAMRFIGEFTAPPQLTVGLRSQVIVRTERGLEHGEVLCPATPQTVAMIPEPTHGDILRILTPDDQRHIAEL